MLQHISTLFWRIAGIKTFIPALVVYLFFGAYMMPQGLKTMQELSGKKLEVLDLQFYYTEAEAKEILSAYGPDLLKRAAVFEAIADTLYPVAYTFLFIIMLAWIYKSVAAYRPVAAHIHLLPLVVMLADYCENTGIIRMLLTYPDFGALLPGVTTVFTMIKWSVLGVEALLIFYGLGLLFYYRVAKNR